MRKPIKMKIKIITVRTLKMFELNIFLKSSDIPNISTREKHQEITNTNFPISKAKLMPQISISIQKILMAKKLSCWKFWNFERAAR